MKNNTEKLKNLLSLALHSTPDDFALQEIKGHIRNAIVKLERVEKARERREQSVQKTNNWPVVSGQVTNPHMVRQTIDQIDELIALEKSKINEIANRRKTKHEDDDNVQTILD